MQYTYGDIPDNIYVKPFLLLFSFLWRVFREYEWGGRNKYETMDNEEIHKFFETILSESINTMK